MSNIIELFENSPRLAINIIPVKIRSETAINHLKEGLLRFQLKQEMRKAATSKLPDENK